MPEILIGEITEVDISVGGNETEVQVEVTEDRDEVSIDSAADVIVRGHGGGGLPKGGQPGDIIIKRTITDYDAEWAPPANRVEEDNTLPITAAAVYTEIGNINALLATI